MDVWILFLKRILRPFTKLRRTPLFFFYFLFVVCFFGALGAWIPAGQIYFGFGPESVNPLSVYRNLATYIISIAVTALADYIVRDDDATHHLFFFSMTIVFAVTPAIIVLLIDDRNYLFWLSSVGGVMAAFAWLNVHESDQDLTPPDSYSPLGGEPSSLSKG